MDMDGPNFAKSDGPTSITSTGNGDGVSSGTSPTDGASGRGSLRSALAKAREAATLQQDRSHPACTLAQRTAAGAEVAGRIRARARRAAKAGKWSHVERELSDLVDSVEVFDPAVFAYRARARLKRLHAGEVARRETAAAAMDAAAAALCDAQHAVALDASFALGHYRQACALVAQENYLMAGESLRQTLSLSPRDQRAGAKFDELLSVTRRARPFFTARRHQSTRVLGGSPPRQCSPPLPPAAPMIVCATSDSITVRWPTQDSTQDSAEGSDGSAEVLRYSLEIAEIDPLSPEAPPRFRVAYEGLPASRINIATCASPPEGLETEELGTKPNSPLDPLPEHLPDAVKEAKGGDRCDEEGERRGGEVEHFFEAVPSQLLADCEYTLRLRCANACGWSEFSPLTVGVTAPLLEEPRRIDTRIPPSWMHLRGNLNDLLVARSTKHGVEPEKAWLELVEAWRSHIVSIKLAYRLYVLLESPDSEPRDMNLTQFRKFVEDAGITPKPTRTDQDLIFTRANRVVSTSAEGQVLGGAATVTVPDGGRAGDKALGEKRRGLKVASQAAKLAARLGAKSAAIRTDRMDQAEFVHAIVRLGAQRADRLAERCKGEGGTRGAQFTSSLAATFDSVMLTCVAPNAVPELDDGFGAKLKPRGVRAVLLRHRGALVDQFERWSANDKGVGESEEALSLGELMLMLKAARILDERCTAKLVTAMFCRVNAANEIYLPRAEQPAAASKGRGSASAELDYDEFTEMVCRICDAKLPESTRGDAPFEHTLDMWLSLVFLPALRNAKIGLEVSVEGSQGGAEQPSGTSAGVKYSARRPALAPTRDQNASTAARGGIIGAQ